MIYDWKYLAAKLERPFSHISSESELRSQIATMLDDEVDSAFKDLRLRLGEHLSLDHAIFLFGNGTSIYAGSTSTMDFSLRDYAQHSDYIKIKEELDKICDSVHGIEEQLNALITIRSYFRIMKDENREQCVTTLIERIKNKLIVSCVNSIDYKKLSQHEALIRKLRTLDILPKTRIFTTNYDLAFEYTMDSLGIEYTDGFSGFVNRRFNTRALVADRKPSIIKLHGSVNWIIDDSLIKEIQPEFNGGKLVIEDTAPLLIYPTSDKLYQTYSTPYSELLRHMLDEMETGANLVVVIGYKYGDEHVNDILFKALDNSKNVFYFFIYGNQEECEFISKKISPLENKMKNINILSGSIFPSFDVFVNRILHGVAKMTDDEKNYALLHGLPKKTDAGDMLSRATLKLILPTERLSAS